MYTSIANHGLTLKDKLIENYYILNQIVQSIDTGIAVFYEKKLVHVNNELRRITGCTYKYLENNLINILLPSEYYNIKRNYIGVLKHYSEKADFYFSVKLPNGNIKRLRCKFTPIRILEKGGIFAMVHESENIGNYNSPIYLTQSFWRKYMTKYNDVFKEPYDFVIVIDKDGVIRDFSRSAERFLGLNRDIFLGHRLTSFVTISNLDELYRAIDSIKTKKCTIVESLTLKLIFSDKSEKQFYVSILPIDFDNYYCGYCFVVKLVCVTDSYQSIHSEEIAANITHELRSPLNAIIGFSNILDEQNLSSAERNQYITYIRNSCVSLLHLIDDFVDINKLERNKISISQTTFDLNKLFDELEVRSHIYCKANNKTNLIINKVKAIPEGEFLVIGDWQRIMQVLINLLTNAIKFTETGSITYSYTLQDNYLVLSVQDTGIGIPTDMLTKIFGRFTQVGNLKNNTGLGLGLSITKSLVELMKGTIDVKSQVGIGSEFIIRLPQNKLQDNGLNLNKNQNQKYVYNFDNKTILIAEDSRINYILLEKILAKTGAKILWAQNGKECISIFNENPSINLILMDMQMPIMDGYEAAKIISEINPKIPIIAQTAFSIDDERERIKNSGCIDYIAKPIDRSELLKTIATLLS